MRAFVLSLSAVTLVLLLVMLYTTLSNYAAEMERSLEEPRPMMYAAVVLSSIGYEIAEMCGPGIDIIEDSNSVRMVLSDMLPNGEIAGMLASYSSYLQGNFSGTVHADVRANASNLTNGSFRLMLMDYYLYENNYTGDGRVLFGTDDRNSSTNATYWVVNLSVAKYRASVVPFTFGGGNMNVTIRYSDLNGTVTQNGFLSSTGTNRFTISYYYAGLLSVVEIELGQLANRSGAFSLTDNNASPSFSIELVLPRQNASMPVSYRYDTGLSYVQAGVNRINKSGYAIR